MKALVVYGSTRGGTEGLAQMLGEAFAEHGVEVTVASASDRSLEVLRYDLVVVGGALYMSRWHKDARRFVRRSSGVLRTKPVWFFSSGPIGEEAPPPALVGPTGQVESLMESVGARGHRTFGGRLARDVHGFPAAAMAKTMSGDWRDTGEVQAWAKEILADLT